MKKNNHEEYKENVCSILFTVILSIIFFFMLIGQLATNFVDDLFSSRIVDTPVLNTKYLDTPILKSKSEVTYATHSKRT